MIDFNPYPALAIIVGLGGMIAGIAMLFSGYRGHVMIRCNPLWVQSAPTVTAAEKWKRMQNPKTVDDYKLSLTLEELKTILDAKDLVRFYERMRVG